MGVRKAIIIAGSVWLLYRNRFRDDNAGDSGDNDVDKEEDNSDSIPSHSPKMDIFIKDKLKGDIGIISYDLGLPSGERSFKLVNKLLTVPVSYSYTYDSGGG